MCFDLGGILSSGCSSNTTNTIRTEQTIEQITKVFQRHSNTSVNSTQLIQDMSVNISGTINCPQGTAIEIGQSMTGDFQFIDTIDDVTKDELKELLTTKLTEATKMTVDQYQGFLSQKFNGDVTNNITNILKNVVDNEVTVEKLNTIKRNLVAEQHMTVNINAVINSCLKLSQDMLLKIMARSVITNISEVAIQNSTISEFMNTMDTHVSQRSEGLGNVIQNVVKSVTDFLKSAAFMWMMIIIVVVVAGAWIVKTFLSGGGDPEQLAALGGKVMAAAKGSKSAGVSNEV